jgi:hypothetical protein
MQNQWFAKWHHIGEAAEAFREEPIHYSGIKFSGFARAVYWDTVQLYLRKKIAAVFGDLEPEFERYTLETRDRAITEVEGILIRFAQRI